MPFRTKVHTKRSGMDHTVLPANNTTPAFPSWRSPDVTTTATEAADIQLQLTTHLSTSINESGPCNDRYVHVGNDKQCPAPMSAITQIPLDPTLISQTSPVISKMTGKYSQLFPGPRLTNHFQKIPRYFFTCNILGKPIDLTAYQTKV